MTLLKQKIEDFAEVRRRGVNNRTERYPDFMKRVVAKAKVKLTEEGWVKAQSLSKKTNGWAAKFLKLPAKTNNVCHVKVLVLDNQGLKSFYYQKDEAEKAMKLIADYVGNKEISEEDILAYMTSDEFATLLKQP